MKSELGEQLNNIASKQDESRQRNEMKIFCRVMTTR